MKIKQPSCSISNNINNNTISYIDLEYVNCFAVCEQKSYIQFIMNNSLNVFWYFNKKDAIYFDAIVNFLEKNTIDIDKEIEKYLPIKNVSVKLTK